MTKLQTLRDRWASGDKLGALAIAAKFPRLGEDKTAIDRAWAAHKNPQFYKDIGHDPDALVAAGLGAIAKKYDLP